MRHIENKIEMSNGIMFALLGLCLILSNSFPIFSFLFLVSIIPTVFIGIRMKPANAFITIGVMAILMYIAFGLDKTVYSFLIYVLPSLISGIIYGKGVYVTSKFKIKSIVLSDSEEHAYYASLKLFLMSILLYMVGAVIYFVFARYTLGVNVLSHMKEMINTATSNYTQIATKYNISNNEMKTVLDSIIQNSGAIVLTIYFIKSTITALISYFIAIPLLNRIFGRKIYYTTFDLIVLPGNPAILYLVFVGLSFLIDSVDMVFLTPEMINGCISVLSVLFFIQGLSLIVYMIKRWSSIKANSGWIIVIAVFLFMGIFLGIVLLGVMDNIFNYREKWNNQTIIGGKDE